MPITFDTPHEISESYPQCKVETVEMYGLLGDEGYAQITVWLGHDDAGTFVPEKRLDTIRVDTATFTAAMDAAPSGATNREVVRNIVYSTLLSMGAVDAGTVS